MVEHLSWEACEVCQGLVRLATFSHFIAAKHFRISFLYQLDPDLFFCGVSREKPAVFFRPCIVREVIIDHDVIWLPIDVKSECVCPRLRDCFCVKQLLDAMWIFGQSTQTGQKVTVTEGSLRDVLGFNASEDTEITRSIHLYRTSPLAIIFPQPVNFVPSFFALRQQGAIL